MQNNTPAPRVHSPCTMQMGRMHDLGLRTQFCERCLLPVHNLSAMSEREAADFLKRSENRRVCISYELRRDGSMATLSGWRLWRGWWRQEWRRWLEILRLGIVSRHLTCATLRRVEASEVGGSTLRER